MSANMNTEVAPGDKVSWSYGGSNPSATVEEVKPHDVSITTHRGNEVKKSGDEENPAVKVSMGSGKPAARQAHELQVEKEGPQHDQAGKATSTNDSGSTKPAMEKKGEEIKANKQGKSGNSLEVPAKGRGKSKSKSPAPKGKSAEPEKKEEKKTEEKKEEPAPEKKEEKAEGEKGKRGRKQGTKAAGGTAKPKAEKPKKRAATEDGEPRRSKRSKA